MMLISQPKTACCLVELPSAVLKTGLGYVQLLRSFNYCTN